MIVPAFGSNKFIEEKNIAAEQRAETIFRKTKLIFIIFDIFLFFSKMKMRNEIAAKRIGNGNKREEGKELLLVPSEKRPQCRRAGKMRSRGNGRGGRQRKQTTRQETNASSIKQKCSVNSRNQKKNNIQKKKNNNKKAHTIKIIKRQQ